jgi:predicted benzoate:H+ symporter BenE
LDIDSIVLIYLYIFLFLKIKPINYRVFWLPLIGIAVSGTCNTHPVTGQSPDRVIPMPATPSSSRPTILDMALPIFPISCYIGGLTTTTSQNCQYGTS